MFFDSHAHFSSFPDDESRAEVVKRAIEAGVDRLIAVGGSRDADRAAIAVCRQFPDAIGAAIGYDRDQVEDLSIGDDGIASVMEDLNEEIGELCESGIAVAAIGEIGLDFHYSAETSAQQIELLDAQLGLACERELPVIVHIHVLLKVVELQFVHILGIGVSHKVEEVIRHAPAFDIRLDQRFQGVSIGGVAQNRLYKLALVNS